MDPDVLRDVAGYVAKMWLLWIALSLPAQWLLGIANRTTHRNRRTLAVAGAGVAVVVAALVIDLTFYPYDGTLAHTLGLLATLAIFAFAAHVAFFFAIFRFKRIAARVAFLAAGGGLMVLGVMAFGLRSFGYGLQHSLGGWP